MLLAFFQTGTQVANKISDEMFKRLDALGQKLGVAVTALWGIYVRQGILTGVQDLVIAVIALVIGITCLFLIRWLTRCAKREPTLYEPICFGICLCGVALLASLLMSCDYATSAIPELLNPGYWAVHQISSDLHGL